MASYKGLAKQSSQRIYAVKDSSDNDTASVIEHSETHNEDGKSRQNPEGTRRSEKILDDEENNMSDEYADGKGPSSLDDVGDDIDDDNHSSESIEQNPTIDASSISFGELARAQEILGKRKRTDGDDLDMKSPKELINHRGNADSEALERKAGKEDKRDFARASKHAPTELSSKKAVSRKRSVVPTHRIDYRDPRFEPVSGQVDDQKVKKNYLFLNTYRDSEMAELKSAIRKGKDLEAKEKLKCALLSMESRKKAQQTKDQRQEVLRKHRKEEKDKIEQGKKPFYLKKAEQKKLALVERFDGMKGKQVDRVIERRRKKAAAKERKAMPTSRRA
ncbi:rRNA biogenesis protein rrp36 [Puttea exsequens]|nr:rRNA biogenesis protein rrp36 [Puttea exsequens]